jgi:hypothetical protein
MCLPLVFGDLNLAVFLLSLITGALSLAGIMDGLQAGIVLLVIGLVVLLVGLGSRGIFGSGLAGTGVGGGGFLLGDVNFVVFALGIICGALGIAGIMTGFQEGIVLLVIAALTLLVGIGSRGVFGGGAVRGPVYGNRAGVAGVV